MSKKQKEVKTLTSNDGVSQTEASIMLGSLLNNIGISFVEDEDVLEVGERKLLIIVPITENSDVFTFEESMISSTGIITNNEDYGKFLLRLKYELDYYDYKLMFRFFRHNNFNIIQIFENGKILIDTVSEVELTYEHDMYQEIEMRK